jgi:hypothetical protein
MRTLILEVRDRATCIPVLAVEVLDLDNMQNYYWLHERCGHPPNPLNPNILVTRVEANGKAYVDPYDWSDRTMKTAHHHIISNWGNLKDGEVVDVEFILGETKEPKQSEYFERGQCSML